MAYLELVPKLVLSSARLVTLSLLCLRHTLFYVELTPEVIASKLVALPTLIELAIGYEKCQHPEDCPSLRDSPQTRIVLPALTHFRFEGDDEYLEYFVSRIGAPLLNHINILSLDYVSGPAMSNNPASSSVVRKASSHRSKHLWMIIPRGIVESEDYFRRPLISW